MATRTGCTDFNKIEFLDAIASIRAHTFKPSTIISSWRKSGLIPFYPEIALCKVRPRTPEPDSPTTLATIITTTSSTYQPKTSTTVRSTRTLAFKLKRDVYRGKKMGIPSFNRFIKGALVNVMLRQRAEEEVEHLQAAAAARLKRQKPGKKIVQKGGIVYARDAHVAVNKLIENEAEKAGKAAAKKVRDAATRSSQGQNQGSGSQS